MKKHAHALEGKRNTLKTPTHFFLFGTDAVQVTAIAHVLKV